MTSRGIWGNAGYYFYAALQLITYNMPDLIKDPFLLSVLLGMLFLASLIYSSVGHGGASAYIAILAMFNFQPLVIKPLALTLNIFVSLLAFIHYYRKGYFNFRLFYPFAFTSFPAAFLGAMVTINASIYKTILGICLIFPILRLLGFFGKDSEETKPLNIVYALIAGALIGFLSGMIGIGGGIILSPLILLFHWANMKQTAAVSALFIFVNSVSGLMGVLSAGVEFYEEILWIFIVVLIGGFIGGYLGGRKFDNKILRYILAVVLSIAAAKLIFV
jgi:uncharacterized protein